MNLRLAILAITMLLSLAGVGPRVIAQEAAPRQSSTAPSQPDPSAGKEKATQVCAACHGADGNSLIPQNPVLAGQGYSYLYKQLRNFKGEPKKDETRSNAVMSAIVATLSDEDMRNLASYFSAQQPAPRAATRKDTIELGQKIYRGGIADREVPACSGCHGATGAGVPSQFPRLAGQYAQYTDIQLKAWRSEERANDPNKMMRMVASKMNDREIAAVADYIAGLH